MFYRLAVRLEKITVFQSERIYFIRSNSKNFLALHPNFWKPISSQQALTLSFSDSQWLFNCRILDFGKLPEDNILLGVQSYLQYLSEVKCLFMWVKFLNIIPEHRLTDNDNGSKLPVSTENSKSSRPIGIFTVTFLNSF